MEALLVLAVIAAVIGLRVRHERWLKSMIDAGLITRKPRTFVRRSRYQ